MSKRVRSCLECKHVVVKQDGLRNMCGMGAAISGAPITCVEARGNRPWCWCGPTGRLFEHRLSWWRRLFRRRVVVPACRHDFECISGSGSTYRCRKCGREEGLFG